MTLVRRARGENATVAVSIFVNPTQFGANEDLSTYPRDMERDLALLEAEGVDLVYAPSPEEVYPPGFDTWIEPGDLAERLGGGGPARPFSRGGYRGGQAVQRGEVRTGPTSGRRTGSSWRSYGKWRGTWIWGSR